MLVLSPRYYGGRTLYRLAMLYHMLLLNTENSIVHYITLPNKIRCFGKSEHFLSHMWQPSRWTQNNWKPVICHSWWTNRWIYVTQKCQISEQGLYENLFKLNCEVQRHARQSDIFLIERCHSSFAKHMPPFNVKDLYVGNVEARTYRSSSLYYYYYFVCVSGSPDRSTHDGELHFI